MTIANILGGILFGSIGFVAFVYGKKTASFRPMLVGIALMVYPYFVPETTVLYIVGAALTAALFLFKG
jgi:hypothetical protein